MVAHIPQVCGAPASFARRRLCVLSAEATARVPHRGGPLPDQRAAAGAQARPWQQPPQGGSTRGRTECRSQASLRVTSTGIGRAESIPEGGL